MNALKRKIPVFIIVIVLLIVGKIVLHDEEAIDINNDQEVTNSIRTFFDVSGEIRILDKQFDETECFVLFVVNDDFARLAIFGESLSPFDDDYVITGGSWGSQACNDFYLESGNEKSFKNLLVVFGDADALVDKTYTIHFEQDELVESLPETANYFMKIYRYNSDSKRVSYTKFFFKETE